MPLQLNVLYDSACEAPDTTTKVRFAERTPDDDSRVGDVKIISGRCTEACGVIELHAMGYQSLQATMRLIVNHQLYACLHTIYPALQG